MTKRISVTLPDEIFDRFDKKVKDNSINRSKLVAKLIEEWIEKQDGVDNQNDN